MKTESIDIVIAADNNYAQHCCVLITSILLNNKNTNFDFHILDGGITDENKKKIEKLKLLFPFSIKYYDMTKFDFSFLPMNRRWISISTYYRLLLTKIIPQTIKKVLYLDCDIVVDGNISDFWDEDVSDYFACVVEDEASAIHSKRLGLNNYFNAGVLILNMDKLRSFDFINEWQVYFKENENIIKMQDQDILNGVFNNNVKFLSLKWNANTKIYDKNDNIIKHFYDEKDEIKARNERVIIHYTGPKKPWLVNKKHPLKYLYLYYLIKSPYKTEIFSIAKEYTMLKISVLLKNIFSIVNAKDKKHKIITILGIKIKIKRNKYNTFEFSRYVPATKTYKKLICINGFGHSGSGAVLDYLTEFNNITVLGYHDKHSSGIKNNENLDEIKILRCNGGIFDLEKYLSFHNFGSGTHAIKSFFKVVEKCCMKGGIYTDEYWRLSNKFIEYIIYYRFNKNNLNETQDINKFNSSWKDSIFFLKPLTIEEFQNIAREYIDSFLKTIESKEYLVLDQFISTSVADIEHKLKYLKNAKVICVYRDPRDVYVTGIKLSENWIPKDYEVFVKWYLSRGVKSYLEDNNPNKLMLRFEDVVLKYDIVSKQINEFLGLAEDNHIHKKEYFNPQVSIKNIGLYKDFENQTAIKYIEDNLSEYCYNLDR